MSFTITFENEKGDLVYFEQEVSMTSGFTFDNERSEYNTIEIDGHGVFISTTENSVDFAWDQDGYVFLLVLGWENVTVDDAVAVFRSIQPVSH